MDEKMRILKMVEEGKISAEQAVSLLDALDASSDTGVLCDEGSSTAAPDTSYESKMLRILVDSPQGDKVNVQLPVSIIRQMLKVTGKFPILSETSHSINLEDLTTSVLECLDQEALGNIIDVNSSDGSSVKIFIG